MLAISASRVYDSNCHPSIAAQKIETESVSSLLQGRLSLRRY